MLRRHQNSLWFSVILVFLMACGSGPPQSKSNAGPSHEDSKAQAASSPEATNRPVFSPENFRSKAVFELVNHQSGLIQQGSSKILTESAMVAYSNGLMPGNSEGLEIQFFAKPITAADRADVLDNEAREMRKTNYAVLILYLGGQNRISQANLTYIVPGTTVTRTVASNPDDLKKYFSDFQFDGKRLRLKSNGTYDETDTNHQTLSLAWTVDIDLPVIDRRKK